MLSVIDTKKALLNSKLNPYAGWNKSQSNKHRSEQPDDVSNRIFDGFAAVKPTYAGPRFSRDAKFFAMGSCFAREIETELRKRGGKVISIDDRINVPAFQRADGGPVNGFLHRYTPWAMALEFQQSFGELPQWTEDSLLFSNGNDVYDVNYFHVGNSDTSREGVRTRRQIAASLVREAQEADVVILTLGLIESWFHIPTGLHANRVPPQIIARRRDEFELRRASVEDTIECLRTIHELISRKNTKPFQLVVTVSPVPLTHTFTELDLIVANMDSKSTLRAAAAQFCQSTENATYFPSYEIVNYSRTDMAWLPDRIHVEPKMVAHIMQTFIDAYFEEGAFGNNS